REAAELPPAEWPDALPEPLPAEVNGLLKKLRAVGQAHHQAFAGHDLEQGIQHGEALVAAEGGGFAGAAAG
ncbi:hypothetical protein R0G64_32605, partial [Pseudomonas otitidis]|nr:hypothetical protein [Pseudomonas otitidis]